MSLDVSKAENNIRCELDKIKDILTFCCGEKYKDIINKRLKDVRLYVYNIDFNPKRLKQIDMLNIAIEYSRDFTYNLHLDDQRRKDIELLLGKILLEASDLYDNNSDLSELTSYIGGELSNIDELKDNIIENTNTMMSLVEFFKKDHEVKQYDEWMESSETIRKKMFSYSCIEKANLLNRYFNIDVNDYRSYELWQQLSSFGREMEGLLDEPGLRQSILDMQASFCKHLGASGDTSIEIINDAKYKGIFPSVSKVEAIERVYEENLLKKMENLKEYHTNLDSIFNDLDENEVVIDERFYTSYILSNSRSLLGLEIVDINGNPVAILFNNNHYLYSDCFIDTYFHELIHYCGGVNKFNNKHRLVFNNDIRYLHLDEAFTNYLAKRCYEEYFKEYNYPNALINVSDNCDYNCTLEYMDEVYKLYKDELLNALFSDSIKLNEAKRKFPIEDIANSVYKIKSSDDNKLKEIIEEEIRKLNRRIK